jgi:hypothetical protein
VHTEFWSENRRERGHLKDLGLDRRIISLGSGIFRSGMGGWTGLMWLISSANNRYRGCFFVLQRSLMSTGILSSGEGSAETVEARP